MANIKAAYAASSNLTVTNLASLATSATWVGGWESNAIDNTVDLYLDYQITAKIVVGNGATAGQIRMYAVPMLDDSTWPDVMDGTESTETWTDTEIRDAAAVLIASAEVDADAGVDDTYYLQTSITRFFGVVPPAKFVLFITHSSGVNLAGSGHQVTIKGEYMTA